jgi:hypothetical protein
VRSISRTELTTLPLLECKRRLLQVTPMIESRLMFLDHIEERGCDLSGWRASGTWKTWWRSGGRAPTPPPPEPPRR